MSTKKQFQNEGIPGPAIFLLGVVAAGLSILFWCGASNHRDQIHEINTDVYDLKHQVAALEDEARQQREERQKIRVSCDDMVARLKAFKSGDPQAFMWWELTDFIVEGPCK